LWWNYIDLIAAWNVAKFFKLEFTFIVKIGIIDHFGNDLERDVRKMD
jgi:hypothetical protein